MLTYPRLAKACYAFFAVAVLAAILKLSISGATPSPLKMLPAAPTASATEPAAIPSQGPGDPRLGSFSDDGAVARPETAFSRSASRERNLEGPDERSDGPSGEAFSGDAPVFHRPSLERGSFSEPVCGDLGDVPRSSRVVFPLPKAYFNSYDDTWGAARPQGGHEGSDLMSPASTPEFALTDGRLVAVAGSNENGWNKLGGYTVMLEAADDVGPIKKGDLFYYAHMDRESSLPVGTEVRAGQRIGTVGDTGEGPEVTRGKFPPHLHLGWYDADLSKERSEAKSGAMNPYPLLLWLERNGGAVSGGTNASYCQAPQNPNPTPSTGEPDWPVPSSLGQRPDLDTGSDANISPSPAIKDDEPRVERPKGDENRGNGKNRGEDKDHEAKATDEVGETEEAEKAHEKAMKLSLRKKKAALLRDLQNLDSDPAITMDADEGSQADRERGDGREDGEAVDEVGEEREEGRQETENPVEKRPEGDQGASPEETLKPPVPMKPAPAARPAPKETGEDPGVVEEPEAAMPSEAEREGPDTGTDLLPDAATSERAGDDATSLKDVIAPVRDEAPPAAKEEAEPVAEPDGDQQLKTPTSFTLDPFPALPANGARAGSL